MLRVEEVSKAYRDFRLERVSFEVEPDDYFVLLGASGVGKTVLLEVIAGLVQPNNGRVFIDAKDVTYAGLRQRRLALVFQDQALFPHLTVAGNIAYGLKCLGKGRRNIRPQVERLAEQTGAESLLNRYPETLSGGEAQRVALARAMAIEPRCLLLDEPLGSLDRAARGELRALLRKLHRQGLPVVHVTHDYEEAISLATRVGVMEQGRLVQCGKAEEVFRKPQTEFVARFTGVRNFFRGELKNADPSSGAMAEFNSNGMTLHVLTDRPSGPGALILGSDDLTLSVEAADNSARNCFKGTVLDVVPAHLGVEVEVDIGLDVTATITKESASRFQLSPGDTVWVSFKASAARFIEE